MKLEPMRIVDEPFTPMHLLRLVEAVDNINNAQFTQAIADAMFLIHHPPMFVKTDSTDGSSNG